MPCVHVHSNERGLLAVQFESLKHAAQQLYAGKLGHCTRAVGLDFFRSRWVLFAPQHRFVILQHVSLGAGLERGAVLPRRRP